MRRSWRALLTTAFCIVVCTVCLALPALAQTTVSVYHRNELREIEWMEQVKEAFEAANPDIKIELIQGIDGGGPGYAERLAVLFASGNPPDVFYGSTDKAGFVLNGWARDITDLIERDRAAMNLDEFFPGVFDSVTRRGRIFGVPTIAMGHAIFYNKQLLSEAGLALPPTDWDDGGWDWAEFVEYAQKLTHAHPDGTLQQAGISSIGITDAARLFGAEWFPPEAFETGIATHATLLQPEMEQAYTEIQKLYSELRVSSGSPNSGVDGWAGFWNETIAMEWTGWWKVRNYLDTVDFDWGIAPLPRVKNRANSRFTDPWFISTTAKDVEAAWRFVKFVTGVEGLESFAEHVAFPPSRRSALQTYVETVSSASGMSGSEVITALSGTLAHGRVGLDEVIGGASVWQGIISEELAPALAGERPVRQALETAQARVDAVLKDLATRWQQ